jgi:zinc transport system ATP-binding protein
MTNKIVEVKNLSFRYTSQPILKNLSLAVAAGDYLSIVGSNGCGKSTLAKLLIGLLAKQTGEIVVGTEKIGHVSQRKDSSSDSFPITVFELLNSYAKILKVKNPRSKITDLLGKMKLGKYRHSLVAELSGGQYQKLLIARCLLGEPELLVLDEPSTGVDVQSQAEIYAILKDLNQKNHLTIIAVEHNLRAAVQNSTAIFHLTGGRGHLCTPKQYLAEFQKENHVTI